MSGALECPKCGVCGGRGTVPASFYGGQGDMRVTCRACSGTGTYSVEQRLRRLEGQMGTVQQLLGLCGSGESRSDLVEAIAQRLGVILRSAPDPVKP